MAFEQKPNSGALFPNDKKADTHPDMKGDLFLDKTFLIDMMDQAKGSLVKISIATWKKKSAKGLDYLSMSASAPYVKKEGGNPWE
jgi:hypothetical protein